MCHLKYYELICTDLSKQTNTIIPQQINFTEKLESDDGTTKFFIAKMPEKNNLKLFFIFIKHNGII